MSEANAQLEDGLDTDSVASDDVVTLTAPNLQDNRFGILGEFWNFRKRRKKRKKLISKGYVQWYLIENGFPEPQFVKPKQKGGGIHEHKHNGERYLFPADAKIPSEQQGMWTYVHKAGEADPINLQDPSATSIPTDVLEEYLQLRVSSTPPSFFDQFDFDAEELFKYGIMALVGLAILHSVLTGGIV